MSESLNGLKFQKIKFTKPTQGCTSARCTPTIPVRFHAYKRYTPVRYTPVKYTPVKCAPRRCTAIKYPIDWQIVHTFLPLRGSPPNVLGPLGAHPTKILGGTSPGISLVYRRFASQRNTYGMHI